MSECGANSGRKQGTRVFKKSSPNGKITTYLCKRDFIDSLSECDPIEGVVLVDPEYIRDRKVFTHVLAAFRYGREDLDVLGLTFRKDLYLASAQVYPCVYDTKSDAERTVLNPPTIVATGGTSERKTSTSSFGGFTYTGDDSLDTDEIHDSVSRPLTRLQERLMKKLGSNAFPFYFKLPPDSPASVMLQPGPNESGKPCGVDYELRTYVADASEEKLQKRNSVRLAIRKLTYAPEVPAPQPSAVVFKDFIMSPGSLRLEVTLDKEKYYHGESIAVNVLVDNNSNKTVKKIKLSVRQYTELCLHNNNRYNSVVDELETEESFPILPSQTGWCKVYRLRPLLAHNRHKRGLALDGKLKHEDTNLASSTIIVNPKQKENLGMIVQYRIKVRLVLGFGSSDVSLELPFTLTHPKPIVDPNGEEAMLKLQDFDEIGLDLNRNVAVDDGDTPVLSHFGTPAVAVEATPVVENDLIVLDVDPTPVNPPVASPNLPSTVPNSALALIDDDLVFEDFARLRLAVASNASDSAQGIRSSGNGIVG